MWAGLSDWFIKKSSQEKKKKNFTVVKPNRCHFSQIAKLASPVLSHDRVYLLTWCDTSSLCYAFLKSITPV